MAAKTSKPQLFPSFYPFNSHHLLSKGPREPNYGRVRPLLWGIISIARR